MNSSEMILITCYSHRAVHYSLLVDDSSHESSSKYRRNLEISWKIYAKIYYYYGS